MAKIKQSITENFPLSRLEPLADGDFRIEFIAHGMTACGTRYYPQEVLSSAATAGLYDGAKMYVNHSSREEERAGTRNLYDWAGTIKPGTVKQVGGNLQAIAHVHSPALLSILNDPVAKYEVGLSHEADVLMTGKRIDGREVQQVESIEQVFSVDWVPRGNTYGRVLEAAQAKEARAMELAGLTIEELQEARPDLVAALAEAVLGGLTVESLTEARADLIEAIRATEVAPADAETKTETEDAGDADAATGSDEPQDTAQLLEELRVLRAERAKSVQEAAIRSMLADSKLTEAGRGRVVEALRGRDLKPEELKTAVTAAVEAEQAYVQEVLKEAGRRTRLAGGGAAAAPAADAAEAYEASYQQWLAGKGMKMSKN